MCSYKRLEVCLCVIVHLCIICRLYGRVERVCGENSDVLYRDVVGAGWVKR